MDILTDDQQRLALLQHAATEVEEVTLASSDLTTSQDASADNHRQPGMLLIISGPAGVGKTTITHHIEAELNASFSVSMTTRAQTAKERDGVDYYFVSEEEFAAARDSGKLLEWARVFENYYGTPQDAVEKSLAEGKLVILEIDVQGAIQVKKTMPNAYSIFILPPSEEELLTRLRARKREDEAAIQRRYAKAKLEIELARESHAYDAFLVNEKLETAMREAIELVQRERASRANR